jgi:hypothetical protein
VLVAYRPVMDAKQPRFEVGKHETDDWQVLFRNLRIASLSNGGMLIAAHRETGVPFPVIGYDTGAQGNSAFHEIAQRFGASVRHKRQPESASVASAVPFGDGFGCVFVMPDLDSRRYEHLVMNTSSLAACASTNKCLIDLHVVTDCRENTILIRSHHTCAEFVENQEGGFVPRKPKLPLELQRRQARCMRGDKVGRSEPYGQRRARMVHDGSSREAYIPSAIAATKDAWPILEAKRRSCRLAMLADEAYGPAGLLQVGRAGRIVWEHLLKFRQR